MISKVLSRIITILVLIIVIIAIILLFNGKTDTAKIQLLGEPKITIYQNDTYKEPGYNIIDTEDTSGYYINVEGYVNTNKVGIYYLQYLLYNKSGTLISIAEREVVVLIDPYSSVYITLNGEDEEYYFTGDYFDLGAVAYSGNNDITNEIIVESNVVDTIPGMYEVKYQVIVNNKVKEIVRTVYIIDYEIEENIDYDNLRIDLQIKSDNYAYTILPDGDKEFDRDILYPFEAEGIYNFDIYLKNGSHKKYSVKVDQIDKEGPTGTCTLTHDNNRTTVTMNVSDKSGISKYSYNGLDFRNKQTVLSTLTPNVTIRAYDKYNNYTDIKCKSEYGTGFRNIPNNKSGYIVCGTSVTKESQELDQLMQSYGYKTRWAVAAAGTYLVSYKYNIPYFWGGKYVKKGFNPEWGCRHKVYGKVVCSKEMGGEYCQWGLDCTGFTSWAFAQAGFDYNIIRQDKQSEGKWGNFNALSHRFKFSSANMAYANQIKPGDIVHKEGHVGLVIGVSADTIQVAEMRGPILIDIIKKSNGASINGQSNFTNFVLMEDFYKMYGNS